MKNTKEDVLRNFYWENKTGKKFQIVKGLLIMLMFISLIKILVVHKLSLIEQPTDSNLDIDYCGPPPILAEDTFYISFVLVGLSIVLGIFIGTLMHFYANNVNLNKLKCLRAFLFLITTYLSVFFIQNYYSVVAQSFFISFVIGGVFFLPTVFISLFIRQREVFYVSLLGK